MAMDAILAGQCAAVDYLRGNLAGARPWYLPAMMEISPPVGSMLREWRQRRRMTQMDLALGAAVSPRHLSFVETGRAQPSREMLIRLSNELEIPLRERNALLVSAGFAPLYRERALGDAALAAAHRAVEMVLEAQKPFPAFALDRHWNIVATNGALPQLFAGVAQELRGPPMNALRISLHPRGLAPRIDNLGEWRAHLLGRLRRQLGATADPVLAALLQECSAYPAGEESPDPPPDAVLVPLRLSGPSGVLSFFSATTVFGTPMDVTLSELAIELFFPADAATAAAVRGTGAR
jgi:transcriptional regulator with XRE-family HTH domain